MSTIPYAGLGPHADYPSLVIDASTVRGGLRHLYLGEDAETWLFLGHAYHADVLAAIATIDREDKVGLDEDDLLPARDALEYTFARLAPCPEHAEDDESCDCDWQLNWRTESGQSNKGKPGYFPVVIWEVEQ